MSDEPDGFGEQIRRGIEIARRRIEVEKPYAQIGDEARDRALNILIYALQLPKLWPETYKLIEVMIPKMEMAGHRHKWISYLVEGVKVSRHKRDIAGQGELSLAIGYLEFQLANYAEAVMWFRHSQKHFQEGGDRSGEGRALNRLAMISMRQLDYKSSQTFVDAALHSLSADDADRANSYYVLGAICHESADWLGAEEYYRRSLKIWEESGDLRRIAWGLRNLGPSLVWQNKYEEAEECYTRALAIFAEVHDPANKATMQVNLANLYSKLGQLEEAAKLLIESKKISKQLNARLSLAKVNLNLGRNLARRGRHINARSIYQESIELWEALGNIASLCNAIDCLGESYMATHEYAAAAKQFEHALDRLSEIKGHARYDSLNKMLREHLVQAQMGLSSR